MLERIDCAVNQYMAEHPEMESREVARLMAYVENPDLFSDYLWCISYFDTLDSQK